MNNNILVYDDNCPICSWYSGLFVKTGLLNKEGREPFSRLQPQLLAMIDFDKARNEIPLLDRDTGRVLYGVDSLLAILGQRFHCLQGLSRIAPLYWLVKKMYKLVSFNRKVIVARKCGPGLIDCSPGTSYFYRVFFMVMGFLFNTAMLFPLHEVVFSPLSYYHLSLTELQAAHFSLAACNCVLATRFSKEKAVEYLGQVNMLALLVVLLLLPLWLIGSVLGTAEWMITLYLSAETVFIFREYLRRMEYAGMLAASPWVVSLNLASLSGFILYLFN